MPLASAGSSKVALSDSSSAITSSRLHLGAVFLQPLGHRHFRDGLAHGGDFHFDSAPAGSCGGALQPQPPHPPGVPP